MSNLTLAIDEELLRKARIAALEQHTSLNDLIRGYIETLTVGETVRRKTAVQELRLAFDSSTAKVGKRTWKREDLHERG